MKMNVSRRQFLQNALVLSSLPFISQTRLFDEQTSVILVRDKNAVDERGTFNAEVIQRMIDNAVCGLVNEKEPKKAWSKLFKPDDIVGIKSNIGRC